MNKIISIIVTGLFLLLPTAVMADGSTAREICTVNQYGDTTCTTTEEKPEVVVHEPVDAAFGDNLILITSLSMILGIASMGISKKMAT